MKASIILQFYTKCTFKGALCGFFTEQVPFMSTGRLLGAFAAISDFTAHMCHFGCSGDFHFLVIMNKTISVKRFSLIVNSCSHFRPAKRRSII